MIKNISGIYTAIVTPFSGGDIDKESLNNIVERQIDGGVDGIVVLGSTGESATLSPAEHKDTIKTVIDIVDGRTVVIAGTGSNCTAETIQYSKEAAEAGADAVLLIAPYYNKPPQRGLKAHFTAVADAINIPSILYNIPSRTAVYLEPETVIELSEHENIIGVKDASSNINDMKKIISETKMNNFSLLSGNDDETMEIIRLGGKGSIAVTSNVLPVEMKNFVDICLSGSWDKAEHLQDKYSDLFRDLFLETNPIPVKALMAHLGHCENELRLPLVPMVEENQEQLVETYFNLRAG